MSYGWLGESDYNVFITSFFVNKENMYTLFLTYSIFWLTHIKMQHFLSWLTKLKTYTIFLLQDRQLSWQFYIFEREMQFWYTKFGNFHNEVGEQHQGMDRPGVCEVPEDSGEEEKVEETGHEIICGAQTTLMVKG